MFESFFRRESIISRLREGPFGNHLEDLTTTMRERGYAADTIRIALRTGDQFARWLGRRGGLPNANETTSAAFIKTLGDPSNAHPPKSAFALSHIIGVLRTKAS